MTIRHGANHRPGPHWVGQVSSLPAPLLTAEPPYKRFVVTTPAAISNAHKHGLVIGLAINKFNECVDNYSSIIRMLRTSFPPAPLVLVTRGGFPWDIARITSAAISMKARGVVIDDDSILHPPIEEQLRKLFGSFPACAFGAELIEWLALTRRTPARTLTIVRDLIDFGVDGAPGPVHIGSRLSYRTVRARLKAAQLPMPARWVQLGSLAPLLQALQRDGNSSVNKAVDKQFGDTSSFNHKVRRLLGVTPGVVRSTVGWEWWVDHFLHNLRPEGTHRRDSA